MSKPSSGSGGTQTVSTNSTTAPPTWVQGANKDLYKNSQDVADQLAPQAIAPVAGLTGGALDLISQLQGNVGSQNGTYGQALGTLNGLQSYNPQQIAAGQLSNTDLSPYLNPFTQNVIDTSMKSLDQQRLQGLNSVGDTAAGNRAFGGSRQGVAEGVTNAQSALGAGQLAAGLNLQNFQQAQGAAGQDIASRLAAASANQNADLQGAGLRLNSANSSIAGAGAQQQTYLQGLLAALQGQGMIQQNSQASLDRDTAVANAVNMLPSQRLALQSGTLNGLNVGSTTQGTQTQQLPPSNGLMQGLGGALSIAGAAGSLFGGGGAFPMVGMNSLIKNA